MATPDRAPLTAAEVAHVARLARLALSGEQIESYRRQLSSILEHVGRLSELDLEGVEPMAHPLDVVNKLDDDVVGESMPLEDLLVNAPAVEGRYLAVPKVLE